MPVIKAGYSGLYMKKYLSISQGLSFCINYNIKKRAPTKTGALGTIHMNALPASYKGIGIKFSLNLPAVWGGVGGGVLTIAAGIKGKTYFRSTNSPT